ncbi:MAG: FAD:protein FMN transferase [Caldilineaceae bacterium]|nr:FAD:protein FMN transferase [Caldilineaceae bacterium]
MSPADPASWPELHFRAMGCAMSVRLVARIEAAQAPLRAIATLFAAVEKRLSRFDPASELSTLNRRSGEWVVVSPLLWSVADAALAANEQTDGLFDPTLLAELEAAGYDRSFDQVAATQPLAAETRLPLDTRARNVERRSGRELRLPPGVRLDLGGIAKGYTAAKAVDALRHWGPCLVDAGGDLVAGDAPPGWPGWPVGVAAPADAGASQETAERDLLLLWLANASVATSGVDYRHWARGGCRLHHIIDPRTGQPAQTDLRTATVLDPSAVRAEAWATAALALGAAAAEQAWLRKRIAGVLVDDAGLRVTPALQPLIAWQAPETLAQPTRL